MVVVMDINKEKYDLNDLKELMSHLRDPVSGCPWDLKQDFKSIAPHTIEEAYEVTDAIERNNMPDLKDELGDLLFQIMFHTQMASEQNSFTLDDVIDHVTKKMIFRHPHVFAGEKATDATDIEERIWEDQKKKEKNRDNKEDEYYLDSITMGLPALLLANKIQKKVHKVGFEFSSINDVFEKLDEEKKELSDALNGNDSNHINEEMGDLLFVSSLLSTTIKSNPEEMLRASCLKFIKRFNAIEDYLKDKNKSLEDASLNEMQDAWSAIKLCTHNQK